MGRTELEELEERICACAHDVVRRATCAHVTLSCAESCTGGLVSAAITSVAGSSEPFLGGVVSYAIPVKRSVLGVDAKVLDDPSLGAVSSDCADEMCAGVARLLSSSVSVSVTGIAGPGGAEPGKPVGTVWFGLYVCGRVRTTCHHFSGERTAVRLQATARALELLCEGIEELSSSAEWAAGRTS